MKKILLIILLFSLSGCSNTVDLTAASDISATALKTKYDNASEVKSKYQLINTALKMTAKADPKDTIKVTVGSDEVLLGGAGEFEPSVKISRWDEVSLKMTPKGLDKIAKKDKKVKLEDGKIKFETPKMSFEMYDYMEGEGGYKYIWYLNEKPLTNKIEFEIESSGLDFFYQPPLTEEFQNGYSEEFQKEIVVTETQVKDLEGNILVERPENVVGSYAVYHSTKGGMNDIYGKDYKVGKAFQVPEPRIYDANGNFTRPEKFIINPTTGKYSITIPQEFLDTAVYPIKSNDTFGYTTNGASLTTIARNISYSRKDQPVGALFTMASAGDVTKLSFGFKSTTDNTTAKGGIYAGSGSSPWAKQGGITNAATILTSDTAGFKDMTYASAVSLEAGSYRLLVKGDGNPMNSNYDNCSIGYDTGDASQGFIPKVNGEASDGTIDIHANITTGEEVGDYDYIGLNAYKISIYATYTPSAAPAVTKPQQIIIFD